MIGNNQIILNAASIKEAFENYLNDHMYRANHIEVTSVKMNSSGASATIFIKPVAPKEDTS